MPYVDFTIVSLLFVLVTINMRMNAAYTLIDFTMNSRLFNNINEKRVKGVFFDCTKHKNVKMVIVRLGQSLCLFKIVGCRFSLSIFIVIIYTLNWILGY